MNASQEKKLQVLALLAEKLNGAGILWALGASAMLYLRGLLPDFHDLDLFLAEEDIPRAREIFDALGSFRPSPTDPHYRTRVFLEYTVEGVDLDILGGFAIVDGDKVYDCSLKPDQITDRVPLLGTLIPLQSPELWQVYYTRMGREDKATAIRQYLESPKALRKPHP